MSTPASWIRHAFRALELSKRTQDEYPESQPDPRLEQLIEEHTVFHAEPHCVICGKHPDECQDLWHKEYSHG